MVREAHQGLYRRTARDAETSVNSIVVSHRLVSYHRNFPYNKEPADGMLRRNNYRPNPGFSVWPGSGYTIVRASSSERAGMTMSFCGLGIPPPIASPSLAVSSS